MIKTEGLNTTVKFGTHDKASISVSATKGTLLLQELAKDKKIGDKLEPDDIKELPKVEIEFFTLESVEIKIKALEVIKRNYRPPIDPNQLAYAC